MVAIPCLDQPSQTATKQDIIIPGTKDGTQFADQEMNVGIYMWARWDVPTVVNGDLVLIVSEA